MTRTRVKLLVGGAVILTAFSYLFFSGMEASQVYYLTVSEFQERASTLAPGEPFRISGRVYAGTLERSDTGLDLRFTVYDPTTDGATLAVSYHGVVPDTFMEDSEVVVEGSMQRELFVAHTLMAKCPSKYEGLSGEEARQAAQEAEEIRDPGREPSSPGL